MNKANSLVHAVAQARRSCFFAFLTVLLAYGVPLAVSAGQTKKYEHRLRDAAKSNATGAPAGPARKPVVETALSPNELAIAQQVERGVVSCELGMNVRVTEDIKTPGYFDVQASQYRFRMIPVVTSTGAIRLEDKQAGAIWLQLPHKSMLMSQKLGSRLADACVTPAQAQIAMALAKNPVPSLLEPALPTLAVHQSTP